MLGQLPGKKRPAPFLMFDHLDEGSGASSSSRLASERVNQEVHDKPGGQNASNNSDLAVPNPTQRRRLLHSRIIDRGKGDRRGRLRNGRTAPSQANSSSDHDEPFDEPSDVECVPDRYTAYDLAWKQCTECQQWRLTTVAALRKPLWTCKNEFWSNRLAEWKVGCSWLSDKPDEQLRSGELHLGAPATSHQMPNQAACKRLSKHEALNKVEHNQPSRIFKGDDKDTNLGGSSNAPILIFKTVSRAGTNHVSRDHDVLRELANKQTDAAAAAVLAFQAAKAAAALNPVYSAELAKPKRGRPLGSVTRSRRDTTPQTTTVGVPSPVYRIAAEGTTTPTPKQSSLDQELAARGYAPIGVPCGLMSIKPNNIFPFTNILTTTVASQMGMMVPPVVQAINLPQAPRGFVPIHGRRQSSQQQQQEFQWNVAIHFTLIPAVEQMMAIMPIQYWPNLQLVLNLLRVEHPHPQDIVHALAALRIIVAPFPSLMQEIDCIAQRYPFLQVGSLPQQNKYF